MITLSVCIPSKNRHAELRRSMATILPMAAMAGATVVVCDQSPSAFEHSGVQVLHRPELNGLPAARNELLSHITEDIALFLDDDTDVATDLGVRLLHLAAGEACVAAWGPVVERRGPTARRLHRLIHLGCLRDTRRLTTRPCNRSTRELFGCCFAVRRRLALAAGGFDARLPGYALGEDRDFCWRLAERGHLLRFDSELKAVHRAVGGQRPPLSQRLRYLSWFASRHGRGNPATLMHALLAGAAWTTDAMAICRRRPTSP